MYDVIVVGGGKAACAETRTGLMSGAVFGRIARRRAARVRTQ